MQKTPSIGTPFRRLGHLRLLAALLFLTMFSTILAGCPPPPHRATPPGPPKPPGAMMQQQHVRMA